MNTGYSHNILNYQKNNLSIFTLSEKLPKPTNKIVKSSKVSKKWLQMIEREMNIKIQYEDGINHEMSISGPNKRKIYFDGYHEPSMTVFEFHGCLYHGCPIHNPDVNKYNKTIEREKYILSKGYKLYRIWEHEFTLYIEGKRTTLGIYL